MDIKEPDNYQENTRPTKRPPRRRQNPIEAAITTWHETLAPHVRDHHGLHNLIAHAPKRWTAYGPLVLLPAGSFTSPAWRGILEPPANADDDPLISASLTLLWMTILACISGTPVPKLTHLAINEGIPLHVKAGEGNENILRSPSGLRMLHGDFGPSAPLTEGTSNDTNFERAFWVSTKQNGITQVWAPRWTMFSRGNITEKARLLRFHESDDKALSVGEGSAPLAIDLYAGIGYFAFSYAMLGCRVLCWELNPWSVEGLRRGAEANGWRVRVIIPSDDGVGDDVLRDVLAGEDRLVVFLEDNSRAAERIRRLDELSETAERRRALRLEDVVHVNCGLLPSCRGSWETAWEAAAQTPRAWIHLHENVGVADIEGRKRTIEEWFAARADRGTRVCVEHVELVKTFAPDVWHCVFDLRVSRDMDVGRIENIT
ncbi:S-adenosyl-L-methionine-dependent methyltransferase [Xylaria sp. CBS 124048]|nr:S-adenosyl-L-methionine-dependent methyltransferase [Xylaria sp. CBS 124048]